MSDALPKDLSPKLMPQDLADLHGAHSAALLTLELLSNGMYFGNNAVAVARCSAWVNSLAAGLTEQIKAHPQYLEFFTLPDIKDEDNGNAN